MLFFSRLSPLFFLGGREKKKHTATVLGSGMSGRNHLLPCTFQKLVLTARATITMGNSTLKTSTAAHPAWRSLLRHAPPPGSPVGAVQGACAAPSRPPPPATASAKAEATSVTPASRLGSGSASEVTLPRRRLRAAEGDTASWVAGSSPPRWESQPRPICFLALPVGPL